MEELLIFLWEKPAWRDSLGHGKLGEKCGVKDQAGNCSPDGWDDVGFLEIRANLWLTPCAGKVLNAGRVQGQALV